MIQERFLKLRDKSDRFSIEDSAQIEPTHPEDPDELYRMRYSDPHGRTVDFDVVFYPERAEIQDTDMGVMITEIGTDVSGEEFKSAIKYSIDRLQDI